MSIAYLANSFPEPVESYVWDEICELRDRGQTVVPCSVKRPASGDMPEAALQTHYVFPLRPRVAAAAVLACVVRFSRIREFVARAIRGPEPFAKRLRCLAHTYLGAYLAVLLRDKNVRHIHVHHGYFSSWVGMVAAQILGAGFSMTLHGSDLLVRADYLDIKLRKCKFCVTVSEFNRHHILREYPDLNSAKIIVQRIGISVAEWQRTEPRACPREAIILSVGRLHKVKNHEFLVLACRALKASGQPFRCWIVGDGPMRPALEELIDALELREHVKLLGYVPREQLPSLYAQSDLAVLTSHSEGVPVTLMEAMAMETLVLAPQITGIPELITHAVTGFLYTPGSIEDFLHNLQFLLYARGSLDRIRQAGRRHVEKYFNGSINLHQFGHMFVQQTSAVRLLTFSPALRGEHEDPVLQQVQLSV